MLSNHMPELSALEMLVTVDDTGSLSAAGKALGLSQQAVSSRMRSLETQTGSILLHRTPRGTSLTKEGVLVAGWAAEVLAVAERMDAGIASLRADHAQSLQVIASQTVAEHLLPLWLVSLRKQQSLLGESPAEIEMSVANSVATINAVRSGKAGLGFIETPAVPVGLGAQIISQDELVVVAAPTHMWARRRSLLTPDELAATPLVTRETGSGTRFALEHILGGLGFHTLAKPALELNTTAAVRSAIASGAAPGVLSILAVRDDLALGRLARIAMAGPSLTRPFTAIWRGTSATPPQGAARDLVSVAQNVRA